MSLKVGRSLAALASVLCLCVPFGDASARSAPDAAPSVLTVVLTSGDTLHAARIMPSGIDMFRIDDLGGIVYAPANRVKLVLDETGANRTGDALDRRRTLGIPLPHLERARSKPGRVVPYGPLSVTRTFTLTETSAFARVDDGGGSNRRDAAFQFDLGRGVNIGARDALAMTVFVGAGDGAYDVGVRYRYRRWTGTRSSFDIGPGLILAHEEPGSWDGKGIGLMGQAAFNPTRAVSVGIQVFSVRREIPGTSTWFGSYPARNDRDSGVMIGVKLGGTPGVISAAGVGLVELFLAGNGTTAVY